MSSTTTLTATMNPTTDKVTFTTSNTQGEFDLLDIFSNDMDFEQAYDMYNNIQEKTALGSFEHLQKVQMLNQQYVSNLPPPNQFPDQFAYERAQILNGGYTPKQKPPANNDDPFDQFFTNTESNALEKFLDNLANPVASVNPLQFYNRTSSLDGDVDFNFEMHTMKVPHHLKPKSIDHAALKQELTEAFAHPTTITQLPSPNTTDYKTTPQKPTPPKPQFVTPPTSGDESKKRTSDIEDDESEEESTKPLKKRKRSSTKPLLSLEQKRLNHSHSEQKRRQLCKLAYQRCLELIIDLDAFNKLPELNESERKSKRARINKDGLPNLSKHNALIRISNEMILIKSMNDGLKKLLQNS
ncbi:conserved hypothetical protein [Candida dubliniensis CD36]|uniref:BHLH domain-containing protein n=1 Tax=Candida dubliniensis (strain CD36 / ATCC MYA-646 / CBS 7987 / NCPF 3949 / NRRL Y-17841) TaxID=573826 RepID=B9WKK0_CANDC|nr:conserved hypothetical protein [Candida dubliniensis CD36]CAX39548.1 conserved hypothetical protein [Candida dubliniensis CD36]